PRAARRRRGRGGTCRRAPARRPRRARRTAPRRAPGRRGRRLGSLAPPLVTEDAERTRTKEERMAGKIVHFELPAADVARAKSFWGGLFGWQFGESALPN